MKSSLYGDRLKLQSIDLIFDIDGDLINSTILIEFINFISWKRYNAIKIHKIIIVTTKHQGPKLRNMKVMSFFKEIITARPTNQLTANQQTDIRRVSAGYPPDIRHPDCGFQA